MEFAAAAVAFVTASCEIAKTSRKCYKAVKRIRHIHEDIGRYATAAEEFRYIVGVAGDTVNSMIDFKLPALEDDKVKAMITPIHKMTR